MDAADLKDLPLFSSLSRRQRHLVAQHADHVSVAEGTKLMEEGRLAYELFVIMEGVAQVSRGGEKVAEVGPGDAVGEIGVIEKIKRTATVIAASPMELLVIYGPEMNAMSDKVPDLFEQLQTLIRERMEAQGSVTE